MNFLVIYCSISLLFTSVTLAEQAIPEQDYIIYDVHTSSPYERDLLDRLSETKNYDFMRLTRDFATPARVLIEASDKADFEKQLTHYKLRFNIVTEDHTEDQPETLIHDSPDSLISFQMYHHHEKINAYLDALAERYAERVSVKVAGLSYEKRELKTITISNGNRTQPKHVVLIDAGIHAREWIAPAAALYAIQQLVENFAENAKLLERYDWVILPVVNPDGYEFSLKTFRFWRKTRRPTMKDCIGTDGNRNYAFHWGEVGASNNCKRETYRGVCAFSEPETQTVRKIMCEHKETAKLYLTLHSYGRYLIYPYGYGEDLPENWRDIEEVAQAGAAAMNASFGFPYKVGNTYKVMYPAAGGSDDYALGAVGIPIAITMELPGGSAGFHPPVTQILPYVQETWTGIRAMAEKVNEKY